MSFYFAYCQENKGLKYGLLFVLKNIQPTFVSTMKYTNIKAKIFALMLQMPVCSEEIKGFAIAQWTAKNSVWIIFLSLGA